VKKWGAAVALALIAHATVIGICWIGARHAAARAAARALGPDVVELETFTPPPAPEPVVAEVRPPVRAIPVPPAAAPRTRHPARAPEKTLAVPAAAPSPEERSPAAVPAQAAAAAAPPPAASASASAGTWLTPPPAPPVPGANLRKVDLQLKHDPTAVATDAPAAAGSPPVRPGAAIESPTLRGRVGRDGSLAIRDKAPVQLGGDLLAPGATLKDWLKDPKQHAASRDGTAALISGKFDITDAIMKAAGQDPYRAERMKMLDATREQRLALAAHERTARQHEELARLPGRLRAIWGDAARPAVERRRLLFALWDECEEAPPGADRRASAGQTAREMIIAFIQSHVARDSADGYGRAELVALNGARESRQRFDPYRSPPSPL
jgi:hypothetical protein